MAAAGIGSSCDSDDKVAAAVTTILASRCAGACKCAESKITDGQIRAKNVQHQRLLQAAADGDLGTLLSLSSSETEIQTLRQAVCSSGCSALHWAAGNDQLHVVEFLLSPLPSPLTLPSSERQAQEEEREGTLQQNQHNHHHQQQQHKRIQQQHQHKLQIFYNVDAPAVKKSLGRTPLHYCCRNGHIETAKWLVMHGADVRAKAKHGVTPFQMAVWQNRLDICRWLVEEHGVVAADEVNDFQCSPVHWIGICPEERANYNRCSRRRPSCVKNGVVNDDSHDDDGRCNCSWYDDGRDLLPLASWLAVQPGIDFHRRQRQGHTSMHKAAWGGHLALIKYLHTELRMWDDVVDEAGNYAASLSDMANTPRHDVISRYLREECSVDRVRSCKILGVATTATKAEIRKAYLDKARMFHPDRINLQPAVDDRRKMPFGESVVGSDGFCFDQIRKAYIHLTEYNGHGNQANPSHSLNLMLQASGVSKEADEDSFFKARLVAVLLEYGDKGIDLSNIRKKWKQVWPNEEFPASQISTDGTTAKEVSLSSFLQHKAGDFIRLESDMRSGRVRVFPRQCSRAHVAEVASQAKHLHSTDRQL